MKKIESRSLIIPAVIAVIAFIIGAVFHLSSWNFMDQGHDVILMIYGVACLILGYFIHTKKASSSFLMIFIMGIILTYSSYKFEHRERYITAAERGNFFILEPYIDAYPTYEDYVFAGLLGKPKYINFVDDCIDANFIGQNCRSSALIQQNYGIDINNMIDSQFMKMKKTAQSIEQGRIKNKRQLERCLTQKNCAMIPLLPMGIEAEEINQTSNLFLDTREMFWELVDKSQTEISPRICEFMDLCRAMRDLNVVAIDKP
jgi:hypothetical protein